MGGIGALGKSCQYGIRMNIDMYVCMNHILSSPFRRVSVVNQHLSRHLSSVAEESRDCSFLRLHEHDNVERESSPQLRLLRLPIERKRDAAPTQLARVMSLSTNGAF